ncbi:LysR substrate-binding domain-containing protein [Ruania suaedae]|uniref:LysR substrate-binding domain-containing protein n=1 Tax=Ruania suaedae TaxID=2897774 RepID=UPI001E545416|nr:LysR substrate-binding domain-containing protein [Ruania suaedae]UFU02518.1 LysR substrate-binding domain-containing protein [Ruania suaedae]
MTSPAFRLGYVPGVTPAKWATIWRERHRTGLELVPLDVLDAERAVREGEVAAALLRPPVDREVLSAIVLYEEASVVVVPADHVVAALERDEPVQPADLSEEPVFHPIEDILGVPPGRVLEYRPPTIAEAIPLVAAGTGVLVVPQSLARLHHRRDLTYRFLAEGPLAPVALCWPTERTTDEVEDLIGVVRGRTVNSSRGRTQQPTPSSPRPRAGGGKAGPARTHTRRSPRKGRPGGGGQRRGRG